MDAGDYPTRFQWFQRTDGTSDGYGQKPAVFTSQGYLWGGARNTTAAAENVDKADTNRVRQTVKLRGLPGVAPRDQLYDVGRNETWTVASVYRSDPNELTCEVYRPCPVP